MRCKKHYSDYSSTVGVCASCLRERLLPLLAVQSPPLIFPRSVSPPRVTISAVDPNRLFYSTPQLGQYNNPFRREREKERERKKKPSALSLLLPNFLRSGGATSSSWFSDLFPRRRKAAECGGRRGFSGRGRGMSPARVSDCGGDGGESSGFSTTPRRSGAPAARRGGNVAAFCLSPLVRPCPNRRRDSPAAEFCASRSRKMADFGRIHRGQ